MRSKTWLPSRSCLHTQSAARNTQECGEFLTFHQTIVTHRHKFDIPVIQTVANSVSIYMYVYIPIQVSCTLEQPSWGCNPQFELELHLASLLNGEGGTLAVT